MRQCNSFYWEKLPVICLVVCLRALFMDEDKVAQLEPLVTEESVNKAPVFTQTDPRTLKAHPQNSTIYGLDEDVTELIALISS